MNKLLVISILVIFVTGILIVSSISDQFVDANSRKKIHFTQTITSTEDPGQGHEGHQLAIILYPSEGTIYDGSLTFTSSEPVQIVVLHEITENDVKGQPTWTIDGDKIYGLSLIERGTKSDSFEFTGAALALHSPNSKFTTTVSVDGWIRGQPTEIVMQQIEYQKEEPSFSLSKTNVAATIPLHKGIFNSSSVFYIITDASDKETAEIITEKQDWKVELAPPIANAPETALQQIFVFRNGVTGGGIYGYQDEVFSSTPAQEDEYSALSSIVEVTWKKGQNKIVFESAEEILEAHEGGRIEFNETDIVINTPQIIWPEGKMEVRENSEITDETSYIGGQIVEINEEEMKVTFIAHRGWGPDGRTIYYIVTDATPSAPAEMMGVTHSPTSAELIANSAAVDLFQFKNGIKGSGPMGFQPGIASSAPGDENYSPIWRIYNVEWNDPENAKILETRFDIDSFSEEDLLTVSIARPMNSDHLVNCPFIDPFQ
ncbi:MAG: hypothetical protein H2B01_03625 [Nitrosopumilaceae archaeon]|uniref:Uncharacterized protein n=1 Tax=Candidatus Nitrosomaritimum aestuariumsis TaxID=3342354 RepID=A0AC60W7G8_9ARCH|nr:hypothetical protein [Nitrosopumilaceae archaeon]